MNDVFISHLTRRTNFLYGSEIYNGILIYLVYCGTAPTSASIMSCEPVVHRLPSRDSPSQKPMAAVPHECHV